MSVNLSPVGGVAGQFFDNSGNPLTGGKLYSYAAGTTTPQTTYTSSAGSTAHANPIVLDAGGRVPGGEIWLTDGSQYKFVLKNSSDVLIGTYDNIVGINSNFINFTNQQEIQTATASQTVFTLATMQYQPATGSLSVFVDGVNQYGPSALYAFTETSSTVVTFTNGLHVGASVKFTTSATNASSYGDASQITYTPAGTGAVATNVQAKLRESVSIEDFGGAAGAGDNTAAMNAAEAYLATLGGGIIVIPYPGEWRMNWVCNTNNITVHGAGGKGEFDLNCIRPYSSASAAITIGDGVTQTRYCGLYNLHISGTDQTAGAISTATGNAPDTLAVRGGVYDLHIDKCVLYNGIRTLSMIPTNGGESISGVTVTRTHIRNDLDGVATARAVYLARYENNVTSPDLGYLTAVNIDNCRVNGPSNGGWIAHCAQLGNVGIVFSVTNSYWDCSPDYGVKLEGSSGIVCHNFQLDPGTSGAIVVETDSNGDIARFIVGNFRIGGQKFKTPAYTYTLAAEADTFNYRARLNTPFLSPTFYLSQTEDPYNTTTYFDRTTASNSAPLRFNGADFYVAKDIYGYGGNGSTAWYLTANSASGGAYLAALGTNQDIRLVPSGTGIVRSSRPIRTDTTTVASLTSAATVGVGSRFFVSDALSPVWGNAVTGGGAVPVPVYSDGTIWRVG